MVAFLSHDMITRRGVVFARIVRLRGLRWRATSAGGAASPSTKSNPLTPELCVRSSLPLTCAGLTALALLATGCTTPDASVRSIDAPAAPSAPVPDVLTSPSDLPLTATPSAVPSPSAPPRPVFRYDVPAAQRRLAELAYYAGPIDGRSGPALRSAVMAFQKVQGLGVDGTIGPVTFKALSAPRTPALRGSAPADRVEVDLSRQVLYIVKGGTIVRILPVSSGNGATYEQKRGGTAKALTPVGYYRIQRRIVGERKADLGTLYDPQYFYRGWAIHGSNSVPARPASHGCVRVTRTDAKYLLEVLTVGMSVYLYGGTHTFTAGSSAPGTDNPTGDTPADTAPEPTPTPSAPRTPAPTTTPSSDGSATPSAAPTATPSSSPSPTR